MQGQGEDGPAAQPVGAGRHAHAPVRTSEDVGSGLFPLEWERMEGTGLRQEAAGPQSSAWSRASHEAALTTAGPGRGLARARDSRQVRLTHTPQDPCGTSSLPGLLPSFYSISVPRAFSRAGSPSSHPSGRPLSGPGLWAAAPLRPPARGSAQGLREGSREQQPLPPAPGEPITGQEPLHR